MRRVSGILEGYGPSNSCRGGMIFNYISLRQDDGKVLNVPNIIAYRNVEAALSRLLQRSEEGRRVTLHLKGHLLIYALEEQDGPIHSDIDLIRSSWRISLGRTFGLLIVAAALIAFSVATGDNGTAQAGFILFLVGLFPFFKFGGNVGHFWPGPGTTALHRRSL